MKFRYYIIDTSNAIVFGTDSTQEADEYARNEDYCVIEADTGTLLQEDESFKSRIDIKVYSKGG